MTGLALEGGGAKGAYQIGVAQALHDSGCRFDGFTGSSMGAVNAAALAQDDMARAVALWEALSMEQVLDESYAGLRLAGKEKLDARRFWRILVELAGALGGRGFDMSRFRETVSGYIDENRVRRSGKDLGFVVIARPTLRPYELFLQDVPQGRLVSYVMASTALPGLKPENIDGMTYLDGGFFDNCPYTMLLERGYEEVVVVRTLSPGLFHPPGRDTRISRVIAPADKLGNVFIYQPERNKRNLSLGYYDGLRALRGLPGRFYYFGPGETPDGRALLSLLDEEDIRRIGEGLKRGNVTRRSFLERIVPQLGSFLELDGGFDLDEFVLAALEFCALRLEVSRFEIYTLSGFWRVLSERFPEWREAAGAERLAPMFRDKRAEALRRMLAALLRFRGGV